MRADVIEQDFRAKVAQQVGLVAEGVDRFRVDTPFRFGDGDHFAIVLKREAGGWLLSDEAHTYMHLTYDIDEKELQRGSRQKIIADALSTFSVEERGGELILPIPDEQFGDALFSYVQALLRIADVSLLSRERVRSTFVEDVRALLSAVASPERLSFDWHEPELDPQANYTVDYRINGRPRPLFIHALPSDGKTRDATISLLQFEKWQIPFQAVGIFEDQERISRRVLARYTDVCENQYSSLAANRERIAEFLERAPDV